MNAKWIFLPCYAQYVGDMSSATPFLMLDNVGNHR